MFFDDEKDKDEVAIKILEELQIFENNFAIYIKKILSKSTEYIDKSFKVFDKLIPSGLRHYIDILSFNYSLNASVKKLFEAKFHTKYENGESLYITSRSNIHGIASYKDYSVIKKFMETRYKFNYDTSTYFWN